MYVCKRICVWVSVLLGFKQVLLKKTKARWSARDPQILVLSFFCVTYCHTFSVWLGLASQSRVEKPALEHSEHTWKKTCGWHRVRKRREKSQTKGKPKNSEGEMYPRNTQVNVTPYTHSTKRHGFHTRERISKNVGEKRQEVGLLSVLEEREEEPVKVGFPNTSHKSYPAPSQHRPLSGSPQPQHVSLNLERETVRGTCYKREDRSKVRARHMALEQTADAIY